MKRWVRLLMKKGFIINYFPWWWNMRKDSTWRWVRYTGWIWQHCITWITLYIRISKIWPHWVSFFLLQYPDIVAGLTEIGHESKYTPTADGFSAVVSVSAHEDDIQGAFDSRRGGYISYTTSWLVQTGVVDGDMLRASQNKVQLRNFDFLLSSV